jgi:hypothetical protein
MSVLNNYQILNNQKRKFDAKNKKDVEIFRTFLAENKWGGPCPFVLEEPYLTIPDMLKDKYIRSQLNIPEPVLEMLK